MRGNGFLVFLLLILCLPALSQRGKTANDADIQSMAIEQYQLFLATHTVIDSVGAPEQVGMVKKVAWRVIESIKTWYTQKKMQSQLKGYNWEINLVDKKEVNAWCMPAGKIVVYTGMLDFAQNEGTLAVVLSHEIAHSLLNHGNERLRPMLQEFMGEKPFKELLSAKPDDTKDVFLMAYGIGTGMGKTIGVMPPFSQENEREADKLGLIFSAMAGYNPREALVVWQRMARFARTARQPEILGAHPMEEKRLEEMGNVLDEISRNYYKPISKN